MAPRTTKHAILVAAATLLLGAGAAEAQPIMGGLLAGIRRMSGPPADAKPGVHLPQTGNVSFTLNLTDGGGYRWDIQYYGTVGQGTNNAYSGGLYCQINGNSVHSNGCGWTGKDSDEVEVGPFSTTGGVQAYRRIKVYKDQPLARWMDIFENPSDQAVTLPVQVYSCMNYAISQAIYSAGKDAFTEADTCFITEHAGGGAPALFHYVCGPKAKIRPTVTAALQNNQLYVKYDLVVPPKGTAILCYFEAQHSSLDDLKKLMKTFRPAKAMRDLPGAVRKLIVNIPSGGSPGSIELERGETGDGVVNRHGDPIFGTVTNESFELDTYFGRMPMPAAQVIGMAAVSGEEDRFQALLVGGQTLAGSVPKDAKINLTLPSGGKLTVPMSDVKQWSYRISKQRPEEAEPAGPMLILRTGDSVAFDGAATALKFRTRHGTVELKAGDLYQIALDNAGNAVHRATFLNGSKLAGFLEPPELAVTLKLGPKLTIPRNLIARMQFAEEEKANPILDAISLSNGDELWGRLAAEDFTIRTDYGSVMLSPESIQTIAFSATHVGRAVVGLWDGSVLRGQCEKETLVFQVEPGPKLTVHVGQLAGVRRSEALPPREVREKLAKLVGQLGAESYKDRQNATEELVKLGKGIIPMLRQQQTASDPEVRQRIDEVIDRLGGGGAKPPPPAVGVNGGVILNGGAVWVCD